MFEFSRKNNEFNSILQQLVKGIRTNDSKLIDSIKKEYAKYNIIPSYDKERDVIALIVPGSSDWIVDAKEYDKQ